MREELDDALPLALGSLSPEMRATLQATVLDGLSMREALRWPLVSPKARSRRACTARACHAQGGTDMSRLACPRADPRPLRPRAAAGRAGGVVGRGPPRQLRVVPRPRGERRGRQSGGKRPAERTREGLERALAHEAVPARGARRLPASPALWVAPGRPRRRCGGAPGRRRAAAAPAGAGSPRVPGRHGCRRERARVLAAADAPGRRGARPARRRSSCCSPPSPHRRRRRELDPRAPSGVRSHRLGSRRGARPAAAPHGRRARGDRALRRPRGPAHGHDHPGPVAAAVPRAARRRAPRSRSEASPACGGRRTPSRPPWSRGVAAPALLAGASSSSLAAPAWGALAAAAIAL